MVGRKTLVLVDMGSLVSQWQEAFQIVWNKTVHILDKDTDTFGDVTIATFQFLHRNPDLVRKIKEEFGMVLVDEFHTAAAGTYRNVLFRLNNKYRIGTSATVMRKGFTNEVLTDLIADVSVEMIDEHALVPSVVFVPTRVQFEYDTPDMFTKICSGLADSDIRNGIIIELVREAVLLKRRILVIGITIAQLKYIHVVLSKFCRSVLYCGTTSMIQDRKLRSDLAAGLIDVILTVKKADKGLDLPMLDTLVLAKPSNNEAAIIQLVGRIVRPVVGKPTPVVYDLADSGKLAGTFARNRMRWYKKQKYSLGAEDYFFVDNR
jgi:superfamily II DNA or RNA helicase